MKNKLILSLLLLATVGFAGTITDPVGDKSKGQKLTAEEFNALKNRIINTINGNIDSANIKNQSITSDDLSDGAVTPGKVNVTSDYNYQLSTVTVTGTLSVGTFSGSITNTVKVVSDTTLSAACTSTTITGLNSAATYRKIIVYAVQSDEGYLYFDPDDTGAGTYSTEVIRASTTVTSQTLSTSYPYLAPAYGSVPHMTVSVAEFTPYLGYSFTSFACNSSSGIAVFEKGGGTTAASMSSVVIGVSAGTLNSGTRIIIMENVP